MRRFFLLLLHVVLILLFFLVAGLQMKGIIDAETALILETAIVAKIGALPGWISKTGFIAGLIARMLPRRTSSADPPAR